MKTGAEPKRNDSPPVILGYTLQPPGELGPTGFHGSSFVGGAVVLLPLRIPFRVTSTAAWGNNDAGRNRNAGRGVGNCLGCRGSRMSSSEEAGTWEETGAAGVKVV
jgi:hypothetical protein